MNARENYLVAAHGGKPERLPLFPDDCNIFAMDFWKKHRPETGTDFLNIKWVNDKAGQMPDPHWHAMKSIFDWKETARFPKLCDLNWRDLAEKYHSESNPDKVNIAILNTMGIFLIPVNMLGWEKALCAILEEPEEMNAFLQAITEFLLEIIKYFGEYIHPDIVFSGDDFAGGSGPFLSPDVFREVYAPYLKQISAAIHEIGALAEFHCCGNCQYVIEEALACGYDICQLPEPNAQLLSDKERFGSRLVLTGGWDRHGPGNIENASEEVVRQSVHTAVDTYGKDGGLIFWDGGIIGSTEDGKNRLAWVYDEARKYGLQVYAR